MAKKVLKKSAAKKTAKAKPKRPSKKIQFKGGSKKKARKYEGASKSKRLSGWKAESSSANTETSSSLPELRNRSRDLRRNNPYAARGIQVITSNVVGTGIVTQFRSEDDDIQAGIHESNWAEWAETPAIDFDGRHNIYGLQRLVMDAVVESGEVLLRRRILAALRYPVQYQVLEPDFLDITKNEADISGGGFIVQGIEFSAQGKRQAYWLYESHPGGYDAGMLRGTLKSFRVPANELYHIFRMDRPGQARGVPWLAPIMVRLKDFDDMEDAQLMRQKIAACFTAFVRDISHEFYAESDDADLYGEAEHDEDGGDMSDRIVPAMIEYLPKGKMVEFADPPSVENYGEYSSTVLHGCAAGLGITHASLTGNYSEINFSSGRMGRIEMNRNVKMWQEDLIHSQMLNFIVDDFKMMSEIMGESFEGITFVHVNPPLEVIDPTKEIPMMIEEMRSGLSSISDKLLALGKDPKQHLKQYAKDMSLLDELGLKLTSDPRVELSARGKNKVMGEIGDDDEKENSTGSRTTPRGLRADKLRRKAKHDGRGLEYRRAS